MKATEVYRQKMEIMRLLADVNDEAVLNDIASRIAPPPCQFTAESLRKRIAKADADIAVGRFTAHEHIERKAI